MMFTQRREDARQRKEESVAEPSNAVAPHLGDMPAAEFRRYGHELIDWIANYFEHIEDLPVLAQIEPGDLKAQLPAAPPEPANRWKRFSLTSIA